MLTGAIVTLVGLGLTWLAIMNWRYRHEEKISLLEAGIFKATGVEPLPLSKLDRAIQWVQIVLISILGPFLIVLGLAFLLGD